MKNNAFPKLVSSMLRGFMLFSILAWSSVASAVPVVWDVNATFDDASGGGSLTGFFQYDATANALLDWSLTVSAGTSTA
jgi:hypothetical protein